MPDSLTRWLGWGAGMMLAKQPTRPLDSIPTSLLPHATLGYIAFYQDWDFAKTEQQLREAIRLDPSYASAHHWYANYLYAMKSPVYLNELHEAQRLDPFSSPINATLAYALMSSGDVSTASALANDILREDPAFSTTHVILALCYENRSMYKEAARELSQAERAGYNPADLIAERGYLNALSGKKDDAFREIRTLETLKGGEPSDVGLARIYMALHRPTDAMRHLESAYAVRDFQLLNPAVDKDFASLKGKKEFGLLLDRIGLPR